jgi:hypothetical protein
VTGTRPPEPGELAATDPAAATRSPERRRFLAVLLGIGAVGVAAADSVAAKPVEDVLDGGRP